MSAADFEFSDGWVSADFNNYEDILLKTGGNQLYVIPVGAEETLKHAITGARLTSRGFISLPSMAGNTPETILSKLTLSGFEDHTSQTTYLLS